MSNPSTSPMPAARNRRARCTAVLAAMLSTGAMAQGAFDFGPPAGQPAAPLPPPAPPAPMPASEQMIQLVARVALYPDDLIAIILPSATKPLQIVQASRYLDQRKANPAAPVDETWDSAVKSLLNYPAVVKAMNDDLDWTLRLGNAVTADQGSVLEGVQAFRRRTLAAGNLKSDPKQTVVVEGGIIRIVPANPQVIYIPQYNPATVVVVGASWGYYPAPCPVYYYPYPPGAAFAAGLVWGAAISATWHHSYYVPRYGPGAVIIVRPPLPPPGGYPPGYRPPAGYPPAYRPPPGAPPPAHRPPPGARPPTGQGPESPWKPSASTGGPRPGYPAAPEARPAGGSSALAGGSGRQTQMDSARGSASRGSAPRRRKP